MSATGTSPTGKWAMLALCAILSVQAWPESPKAALHLVPVPQEISDETILSLANGIAIRSAPNKEDLFSASDLMTEFASDDIHRSAASNGPAIELLRLSSEA